MRTCAACTLPLARSEFSVNQWKKGAAARCKDCVAGAEANKEHSSGSSSGSSSSGSSGSSGSSSGSSSVDDAALLAPFGVVEPLPRWCCANEIVEKAAHRLPRELLALVPPTDTGLLRGMGVRKLSDGWHEGYHVRFKGAGPFGGGPRELFLRIWHGQLSYWRLDVPISRALEARAMQLTRAAGLPTAEPLLTCSGELCAGECVRTTEYEGAGGVRGRGDDGVRLEFGCFGFVAHAKSRRDLPRALRSKQAEAALLVATMARLHAHDLSAVDTAPLARFETPAELLAYLTLTAARSGYPRAIAAAASVSALFEGDAAPPPLPPALLHFDWHMGNVLRDRSGAVAAVIDFEFAGVADARLDVARFCRRERWTARGVRRLREVGCERDTAAVWAAYARERFGSEEAGLARLGPTQPWLALESLQVVVIAAAVCARVRADQGGAPPPASGGADEDGAASPRPRCDLIEWVEDLYTAEAHLERLGLLAPAAPALQQQTA